MPQHKKTPIFLRIVTNEKKVICINPTKLSSFEIVQGAEIKIKSKDPNVTTPEIFKGDTIRFYFPDGQGLSYTVGLQINETEYNYICNTLLEFLYLNEEEFVAKSAMIEAAKMADWNKISDENSKKSEIIKEA